MLSIRFGRWSALYDRHLVFRRIYWRGYKWTPFCCVSLRREDYAITDEDIFYEYRTSEDWKKSGKRAD